MRLRTVVNGARVLVTINTGNAAFEDDRCFEVARILRELAAKVEQGREFPIALMDVNGNRVGSAVLR